MSSFPDTLEVKVIAIVSAVLIEKQLFFFNIPSSYLTEKKINSFFSPLPSHLNQ